MHAERHTFPDDAPLRLDEFAGLLFHRLGSGGGIRQDGIQRFACVLLLFHEFVEQLRQADVVLLAEIYAAREKNTIGISSRDLAEKVPGSIFCPTLEEVTARLRELARRGDLILTVGAGDIVRAGEALVAPPPEG